MADDKCKGCGQQPGRALCDILDDHSVFLNSLSEEDTPRNRDAFRSQLLVTLLEAFGLCASCAELRALGIQLRALAGVKS